MIATLATSKVWNGGEITRDMYEELQQAMDASAERIAAAARQNVPRRTGRLHDSIRARSGRKGRLQALVHKLATGEYETALPVSYVFAGNRMRGVYWHYFVEYGTYDSPAHPFMRPAVDANFNATAAEAERAGKRVLNKRRRERRRR